MALCVNTNLDAVLDLRAHDVLCVFLRLMMRIVTSVARDEAQPVTTSLMVLADSLPPPPPLTPHLLTLEGLVMGEGLERGEGGKEKRTRRALVLQAIKGTCAYIYIFL